MKCLKCFRKKELCICSKISFVSTEIKFVLLMHPLEFRKKKTTGTGILSKLCLKNSEIILGVNFTHNTRVNELIANEAYFPLVLYPGVSSINLSLTSVPENFFQGKIPLVFLIDATWPCAKKMMKESLNLHHLLRFSFNVSRPSAFITRQQPTDLCLSTIEAIYYFLEEIKRLNLAQVRGHAVLLRILDDLVKFQIDCARDLSKESYKRKARPYKKPEERVRTLKWEKRNLFFP